MSMALEAEGDLNPSESLTTTFLMLGIMKRSASSLMTFGVKEAETIEKTCTTEHETATYQVALKSPQACKWKEAMHLERQSLEENQTFEIVEGKYQGISPNKVTDKMKSTEEPIGCKWIYRRKTNSDGTTRYKAHLVIKGYEQKEGIDYDETYVPVSKMATCRLLLALAAQHDWNVDHMDVVTAFLNPKIDQDNIHMSLPLGIDWYKTTGPEITELADTIAYEALRAKLLILRNRSMD
jgi:hypothetical protein